MTTRTCPRCNVEKDTAMYYNDASRKSGISSWCQECLKTNDRLYQINLKHKGRKARGLKKNFDMTYDQYVYMLKLQDNKCAICKLKETARNPNNKKLRSLSVDHDHTTGAIRGLLCITCNIALGMLKDDTAIVVSALEYLTKGTEHGRKITDEIKTRKSTEGDTGKP